MRYKIKVENIYGTIFCTGQYKEKWWHLFWKEIPYSTFIEKDKSLTEKAIQEFANKQTIDDTKSK